MIEERIGGIITNLRPKGVLPNQYGPPQNLSDRMTLEQIPGLSVAVVSDGEIEWARGFGVKEYGQHGPVTTETLFEAASITKTIFTAALMKLASEGVWLVRAFWISMRTSTATLSRGEYPRTVTGSPS